ncbi:MAG TPA: histidine kinase [Verrucomicrobiae bacterium]|jgi:signal transduction histidine kinase|nr:histidine kinase [Verrucomicrobiae bacterium]
MKWIAVPCVAGWMACASHAAMAQKPPDDLAVNNVVVDGKNIPVPQNRSLNLGARPKNITFHFGSTNDAHLPALRIRYRLDGYDTDWHDERGYMLLIAEFYDEAGDQVSRQEFRVTGDSTGWDGSLYSSPLTHRHETVVVPPRASRLFVSISSAGPMTTIGLFAVARLRVAKTESNGVPVMLLEYPPDLAWYRGGTVPSMAKIVTVGHSPSKKALAILDNDPNGHAGWRNAATSAPAVRPGDQITLDWDGVYSMGVADLNVAQYQHLPEGHYLFRVGEFDLYGKPTGNENVLDVIVPPPFWRQPWFWPLCIISAIAVTFGNWRYLVWRKVHTEMLRLKNQQVLEKERLRIAQDIHDDLGARITEISLASALAKKSATTVEAASADFDQITKMSRDLVAALYETVWSVNPEHDNLDSLGTYLCQITNHFCKQAEVRCRLEVDELPGGVQVSSQIRHNIAMAIKESAHNAIKHAGASEITLRMTFEKPELMVCLSDDGVGFKTDSAEAAMGHGLNNIKSRAAKINARCQIESQPGKGTSVHMWINL